ncbi:MAG: hypothetical protein J6U54_05400 [Clostridiales bacterium]|nr:hypothetical protein [Clostridiales bacterium]
MIKAIENFTYYLDDKPLQLYSGQVASLPEGDETYLIETGRAEAYRNDTPSDNNIFAIGFTDVEIDDGDITRIVLNKTWNEIIEALSSGKYIYFESISWYFDDEYAPSYTFYTLNFIGAAGLIADIGYIVNANFIPLTVTPVDYPPNNVFIFLTQDKDGYPTFDRSLGL